MREKEQALQRHRPRCGEVGRAFAAPARVNLIGEHTDNNHSGVCSRGVAASQNADFSLEVHIVVRRCKTLSRLGLDFPSRTCTSTLQSAANNNGATFQTLKLVEVEISARMLGRPALWRTAMQSLTLHIFS